MAKKRTIIEQEIPDDGIKDESSESIAWDTESEELLESIKQEYASAAVKVKVYKVLPGKAQPSFCFSTEDRVNEEVLQENWGGGKYALRFYANGKPIHTEYVEIADKPVKSGGQGSVEAVQIQMLRDNLQMFQSMLMTMINKQGSASTPMSEVVQAWTLLQGGANKHEEMKEMINLFTRGMEMGAKGGGGPDDWKSMLMGTIKDVTPAIATAIAASKVNGNGNSNGPFPNPNGAQTMQPMQATVSEDQFLRQGIDILKSKIIAGLPVSLALDWLVANANDPVYQPFITQAISKNFEDLVKLDADLANEPFNSWVRKLLDGLKAQYKEATIVESDDDYEGNDQ